MLTEQGITSGRLAIYGQSDAGNAYAIFTALQTLLPDLTLVGEAGDSLLLLAAPHEKRRRDRTHPPHGADYDCGCGPRLPNTLPTIRSKAGVF